MNRLQKKCYIVSVGLHSLLVLILLVGPAFLSSSSKSDDLATIDFVPWMTVDGPSGGGNPKAQPPPPAPPAPPQLQAAQPPPPSHPDPVRQPDPPKPIIRTSRPEPESLETTEHKPRLPLVSTAPVIRRTTLQTATRQPSTSDAEERRLTDARRRTAQAFAGATQSLRQNLTSTTTIQSDFGPGGGGEAYANYAQLVKSIYENAWVPPDDTANDDAITKVTVTIASDGNVVSARILRSCGESRVDSSVQRTLDRVIFIRPFPEGAKEKQRTYTINFNLKAKRALG